MDPGENHRCTHKRLDHLECIHPFPNFDSLANEHWRRAEGRWQCKLNNKDNHFGHVLHHELNL